jgi:hypothetical protein
VAQQAWQQSTGRLAKTLEKAFEDVQTRHCGTRIGGVSMDHKWIMLVDHKWIILVDLFLLGM